jgi:deferrochelatase/peroxidase EfeB
VLQEGIYLERSTPPPAAWRGLFLDIAAGTTPAQSRAALAALTALLTGLQRGEMPDLAARRNGEDPGSIPSGTFTFLLGYGASFFDHERHDPPLTAEQRPRHLVDLRRTGSAFPQIAWNTDHPVGHGGEADLLLQLTGVGEHAVDRAAVEVCKLIDDQQLPLITSGTYQGFQRDDGRSWIGFHDGVSNIEPSQRLAAVTCPGDPDWNQGGTYLAFLRIQVDLKAWRTLSVSAQEAIIGRDKLTGCPLEAVANAGGELSPRQAANCPLSADPDWLARDAYFNPPETGDRLVEASHIHRVNQNRAAGTTSAGHRIFRQGYEYLEDVTKDGPRLGLNFVSFQNDLQHLQQVLGLDGWLGDVNFGGPVDPGPGEPQPIELMSLRAGGFYAVPPQASPFPGAGLFEA